MRYRAFQVTATGQWLDVLFTSADGFSVKAEIHVEQVAPAYGLAAADLQALDSDADPRIAPLRTANPVPVPVPTPAQTARAKIKNNPNTATVRDIITALELDR